MSENNLDEKLLDSKQKKKPLGLFVSIFQYLNCFKNNGNPQNQQTTQLLDGTNEKRRETQDSYLKNPTQQSTVRESQSTNGFDINSYPVLLFQSGYTPSLQGIDIEAYSQNRLTQQGLDTQNQNQNNNNNNDLINLIQNDYFMNPNTNTDIKTTSQVTCLYSNVGQYTTNQGLVDTITNNNNIISQNETNNNNINTNTDLRTISVVTCPYSNDGQQTINQGLVDTFTNNNNNSNNNSNNENNNYINSRNESNNTATQLTQGQENNFFTIMNEQTNTIIIEV
ncbi:hypothetical protein ABPG74_011157 [Tetrahymena malaccensis]